MEKRETPTAVENKSVLSSPYFHIEEAVYRFVESRIWPNGPVCPHCGCYGHIGKVGGKLCNIAVPDGLFEREEFLHVGRSMLKRFQMDGRSLEDHEVHDHLLLTF